MEATCTDKTATLIKSITMMKVEELFKCKKRIKELETLLVNDFNAINFYRYEHTKNRLSHLKSAIFDLKILESKLCKKF